MTTNARRVALFAVASGVTGLAGAYATSGWTDRFLVFPIDGAIVELTPAPIVNFMIQNVGESAHYLHLSGAFLLAGSLLAFAAAIGLTLGGQNGIAGVVVSVLLSGGVTLAVSGALLPAATAAAGVGAIVALGSVAVDEDATLTTPTSSRRAVVSAVTGTVAYAGVGLALGSRLTEQAHEVTEAIHEDQSRVQAMLTDAEARDLGINGVPGPVSQIGEFYTVDITSTPPLIDPDEWTLTIRGAVEREVTIDYETLRNELATEHRYIALRCIGEDLNDTLMDTALWSGSPLAPLLDDSGVQGEYVELHSADGYVSTFSREFIEDGLLVYGMNGDALPREHGHPARVVMPGTWGKLNNKWITDVVFVDEPTVGYWEERGWESEAPITTVAKLWTGDEDDPVNRLEDGRLEIGGHAYAGTRGIDRVEVSLDGGDTWTDAELADPLPGTDVTRQWRYRYDPDGRHEVVVRAVDGEGAVQPSAESGSFPAGPSGWVSATIDP